MILKMKKILLLSFVICIIASSAFDPFDKIKDIFSGGTEVGAGVVEKVPDLIPSPAEILNYGKEALLGHPFEVIATAVNKLCSVATSANSTKPKVHPKFEEMKLVLYRDKVEIVFPMSDAEKMWENNEFNKNWPTTVFITGWLTDVQHPADKAIETMKNAYDARGNNNFIVLDSSGFVDTLYTWSAFNTEEIGIWVGKALAKLAPMYPIENIHVMGHSLGAHIAGSTARSFHQETGQLLKRVTGLDPASPCFNDGEGLHGIRRGDAEFIDIIHSNNFVFGKGAPVGDADFFPNGVHATQPGCIDVVCAHARSWQFFAESVYNGNEQNFLGVQCNSLRALITGRCNSKPVPMGIDVPHDAKGNFFLTTRSSSPYGRGIAGTKDL